MVVIGHSVRTTKPHEAAGLPVAGERERERERERETERERERERERF